MVILLQNKEVAEELGITERKVRYQIGAVVEKMEDRLKDFLPVLAFLFLNLFDKWT